MTVRNLQISSEIINKLGIPQIEDVTEKLLVNPKYTWARLAGVRDINNLFSIALHHDAYPKSNVSSKTDMEMMNEIARDHIKSKMNEVDGDAGFPYHFYIRNGRAYQTNDVLDRVYGVKSNNGYTVHVCTHGDYFNHDTLTDADRNALYGVLLMLKQPEVLPALKEIKGHKEYPENATDCPGFSVSKVLSDVRTIENQLEYAKSDENAKAVAFSIANQIIYLANLVNGKSSDGSDSSDGNREWAKQMLLLLEPFMKDKGLL